MKKQHSITALSFLLLVACGGGIASIPGGPKPGWVEGAATEYPGAQYVIGIGMATMKDDAAATQSAVDASARVELTKKLEVSVSSEFTSFQSQSTSNGKTTETENVADLTQEAVRDVDLSGVEIKSRWLDEGAKVVYALAVWPKARAEAQLKASLAEAEAESKKALAEGDAAATTSPAAALKQYVAAVTVLEKARNNAMLLRAVMQQPAPVPEVAAARAKLDGLLAKVTVVAEEGDGQRVVAGQAAPRPLAIRAKLGEAGLAGLALTLQLDGGQIDATATTDAQGLATARVANVGTMSSGETTAVARVNWAALAGAKSAPGWMNRLANFETKFRLITKSMATTRVLVKVIERIEGADGVATSSVQTAATSLFSGVGFGVQDGAALVERIPVAQLLTLDPQSFQKQARDLADVVVIGEAVSSFSSTLSGTVVTHRARLTARAVDLGSGKVLANVSVEAKGSPGDGPEKAGRKALDALAKQIASADLAQQVKTALGL